MAQCGSRRTVVHAAAAGTTTTARRRNVVDVVAPTTMTMTIRTHMNHGGNFGMPVAPRQHGPRQPLSLGLDVTKASQNILRLLEATHGMDNYSSFSTTAASSAFLYQDMSDPCWHASGFRWAWSSDHGRWTRLDRDGGVVADDDDSSHSHHHHPHHHPHQPPHHHHPLECIPTISWLQFSDDRTALAKVQAMDGSHRYLSLLRLDDDPIVSMRTSSRIANDGWVILRELIASSPTKNHHHHHHHNHDHHNHDHHNHHKEENAVGPESSPADDMISLIQCLQTYLDIEHGGGETDYQRACQLFSPHASLLTVGMAPVDQEPTQWSAPVGTLLEIPRETYLESVQNQHPHSAGSRRHDAILQVDLTPGGATAAATAAATVRVGNGAQTMVFVDHLLLGKEGNNKDGDWKILSKTFSPQLWKGDDDDE
jgi:Putative lumazine-binding